MQDLTKMPKDERGREPLPVSGERVTLASERSSMHRAPKPLTNTERNTNVRESRARSRWEATPVGQARTTSPFGPGANTAQIHHMDNYDVAPDKGPKLYDRQLPGMADPDAAPRPPAWHELSDAQRAHSERGLRAQGTSMAQVTQDIGNQLDQAHARAGRNGGAEPYASRFYESGEPRKKIDESAKELGISPLLHAQMNAFTSPNTKFSITRSDGSTGFPNDDAARHVVKHVQQGGTAADITNETDHTIQLPRPATAPPEQAHAKVQGYVTNMRKAASAMEQHQRGVAPADWEFGPNSVGGFDNSPKTGPYANSWSDTHPQFAVSDVHTGGGGAFPHKGTSKELLDSESGSKGSRDKSGREKALESVPYAHSAIDHAMRTAMTERNLGSVRRTQATQWGEEQLQRGEVSSITGNHKDNLKGAPREHEVYPTRTTSQFHEIAGQQQQQMDMRNDSHIPSHGEADRRSPTAIKHGLPF